MKNKIAEYRKWLETTRPGLPPMPKDYIDSQIESIELYVQWLLQENDCDCHCHHGSPCKVNTVHCRHCL